MVIISLVVIFFGVYNIIDQYARGFGYGPIITGVLFYGILIILSDFISTPFSLYNTFIIEEKLGLNKMTIKTF